MFSRNVSIAKAKTTNVISISYTPVLVNANNQILPYSDKNETITLSGSNIDLNNEIHLEVLRKEFVKKLNSVGIGITVEDIEYYLTNNCGGNDLEGMRQFFDRYGKFINGGFVDTIKTLANVSDTEVSKVLPYIWNNTGKGGSVKWNAFIDAISKARYYRISDEQQTQYVTIAGKNQYAMSEQNYITDTLYYLIQ